MTVQTLSRKRLTIPARTSSFCCPWAASLEALAGTHTGGPGGGPGGGGGGGKGRAPRQGCTGAASRKGFLTQHEGSLHWPSPAYDRLPQALHLRTRIRAIEPQHTMAHSAGASEIPDATSTRNTLTRLEYRRSRHNRARKRIGVTERHTKAKTQTKLNKYQRSRPLRLSQNGDKRSNE
jgi:hypothetical protein